ncbi:MAG TPA: DUF72 domain-containing protein [Chloroflexia bacterium]|jgi:uncharacterized protein YecE (DUF72 family)
MIWIGTSGWVYKHWIGRFYPPELKQKDWLAFYAARFPTVEINRSFYRLPSYENFQAWAWQAGFHHGFLFAVKASRYLTHMKRLYGPEEPIGRLMGAASGLGPHLGPFLYQLPPRWSADPTRLSYFISRLPREHRAAFEFRDHSWYQPDIYRILDEAGYPIVRAIGGYHTPMDVPDVGSFRYLRVHGGQYGIGLTDGELGYWADRLAGYASQGIDAFIYFNNDPDGHAIYDAYRLRDMLQHTGAVYA